VPCHQSRRRTNETYFTANATANAEIANPNAKHEMMIAAHT
jgi:hypothetical protein